MSDIDYEKGKHLLKISDKIVALFRKGKLKFDEGTGILVELLTNSAVSVGMSKDDLIQTVGRSFDIQLARGACGQPDCPGCNARKETLN